jgi:hypothetical protein
LDRALELTFPASDPIAPGNVTSTEKSGRPVDRQPPVISREDVERASKVKPAKPAARDAQSPAPPLTSSIDIATQHWMQMAVLPWAGWTAMSIMMLSWPLTQMRAAMELSGDAATHPRADEPQQRRGSASSTHR